MARPKLAKRHRRVALSVTVDPNTLKRVAAIAEAMDLTSNGQVIDRAVAALANNIETSKQTETK